MPAKSNHNLEQAMALLIQNQAAFISQLGGMNERFARIEERMDERFARVDERLAKIEELLVEHHQILVGLPDAIRDKIGFKPRR